MHVDVNNAFLSWTAIYLLKHGYKKDIRNTVSVIGGDETKRHGIVLAKSTPAKRYGIVSAETLYNARRKYPNLEVYPPNYKYYKYMSNKFFSIISKYTPDYEIYSIDECFIEYTYVSNLYGDPIIFANKIKQEIYATLGFTVNIGIANNKLCAKMASDFTKPNRVHTLFNEEIENKMYPLDVSELLYIGKKTTEKLKSLDINTIGDLANANSDVIKRYFKNQSDFLINSARGIDNSEVINKDKIKGVSKSTTLEKNIFNKQELYHYLELLTDQVCTTLRLNKQYGYVVSVQLKDKYFRSYSHQIKLDNSTNNYNIILNTAKILLDEMWDLEPIRLIGIGVSNLTDKNIVQLSFFESNKKIQEDNNIDIVVDKLKEKYGNKIINKANFVKKDK